MTTTARHHESALPAHLAPAVLLALALAALAALAVPLLIADVGPLTSDESLYAQEAFNIARGEGYTYTTGEAVHHRAPLFPALLAADFKVAGSTVESAHWLTKAFALGLAAAAAAIGWRLFGQWTGVLAGAITFSSALLSVIGASLFLDGVQAFFLLLTLLVLHESLVRNSSRWAAAAGTAFGLAILTKESALLWAPLPLLAVFLRGREIERPSALLVAFGAGALVVAGWWWPYVYGLTGQVYLLGDPAGAALSLFALGLLVATCAIALLVIERRDDGSGDLPKRRLLAAGVIVAGWGGLFLYGLEQHSGWPYPNDYLSNVPDYVDRVLWRWLSPLPVIALAWCYAGYRAARGSAADQLLVLGMLLFLPFALFVANRHLHVRDMLPVVALSYIVLARAAVDATRATADILSRSFLPAAGGALAVLLLLSAVMWFTAQEAFRFTSYQLSFDPQAVDDGNWDNPLVHEAAAWMSENLSPGANVMSGRLYHSRLYVLTEGEHDWWQLPTTRVEFVDNQRLVRASTLFRWEDNAMPDGAGDPWMYLQRYPEKLYYIALSERDLLDGLRGNEIDYLVVTGDDAGFSSLGLLPYFTSNPAFGLQASFVDDANDQIHVFSVDRARLQPRGLPVLVDSETVAALEEKLGAPGAESLLAGLSRAGYVTESAMLIPERGDSRP